MPSYKEIKNKVMPPEKKAKAKVDILAYYVGRTLSYFVTIPALALKLKPVTITIISGLFALLAMGIFVFASSQFGYIWAWVCLLIWNILDGVDGNVARFTDTASPFGELWDASVGWLAVLVFYIGMGFAAVDLQSGLLPTGLSSYYPLIGCVIALMWVFPRLIMWKKIGLLGADSVKDVQDRKSYSIPKLIVFNVISINGVGSLLFLIAIAFGICDICLLGYLVLIGLITVFSLWDLLRE